MTDHLAEVIADISPEYEPIDIEIAEGSCVRCKLTCVRYEFVDAKTGRGFGDALPDPCWGRLPGVFSACCGHGLPDRGFIMFANGMSVSVDTSSPPYRRDDLKAPDEWNGIARRVALNDLYGSTQTSVDNVYDRTAHFWEDPEPFDARYQ